MAVSATAQVRQSSVITGASRFEGCIADGPIAQPGDAVVGSEVEPWAAVDPNNPDHIVASWQQDRWSSGGARGIGVAVTFDGGRNWLASGLPGLTPCSGGGEFLRASDPWFDFASNGDLYHATLVVSRSLIGLLLGDERTGRSAIVVHKSTNGGVTWSGPVALVDEDFNGLHDKQSLTADPFDEDYAYAAWDRLDFEQGGGPALFSRTTDGGRTWSAPTVLYDPGPNGQTVGNQIVVLPDGAVVAFFVDIEIVEQDGEESENLTLALARSPDRGRTWSEPIFIAPMLPSSNLVEPDSGDPIRGGEELFDVAVDPARGTLYAVWQDARFDESGHEAVALSASADGGRTWTEPVRINRTPRDPPALQRQAFVPSVAVNARGDAAVTYYDFRFNTPGGIAATDAWAITCRPRGALTCSDPANWGNETRLTNLSFDLAEAPRAGGLFLGDYAGLAASGDDFVAVFAVTSRLDPANLVFRRFSGPAGRR